MSLDMSNIKPGQWVTFSHPDIHPDLKIPSKLLIRDKISAIFMNNKGQTLYYYNSFPKVDKYDIPDGTKVYSVRKRKKTESLRNLERRSIELLKDFVSTMKNIGEGFHPINRTVINHAEAYKYFYK